jgi:glucuronokinase
MKPDRHIIRCRAYPRAGLIGNPSDGYHGKTISFTFDNFFTETVMYESPYIELLPSRRDQPLYMNFDALEQSVSTLGYYGGIRLLQASLKRFCNHCRARQIDLSGRNFSMRYYSNIPHHVGMAGSSAIITACMRGLMKFYDVEIPLPELANMVLAVEREELGIEGGLQDRVAQVYEGVTYMDFDRAFMESNGHGIYEPLSPALLPPLYIAYKQSMSEGSEIFHNDVRARYDSGEKAVVEAMEAWAGMAAQLREVLEMEDREKIHALLDANFDLRREIYAIHPDNIAMVEAARKAGASAKFTGSGGAIIGTYEGEDMYKELEQTLAPMGIVVFKPNIIQEQSGS